MKAHASALAFVELLPPARSRRAAAVERPAPVARAGNAPAGYPAARQDTRRAVSVVTLLAFGQSLVLLVAWLFICALAGAETGTNQVSGFTGELVKSTYGPTATRDPFAARKVAAGPATPGAVSDLVLRGILQHPTRPAAMVNDAVLELNKPTAIHTSRGEIEGKATLITRDRVVLEVGNEKIELRLDADAPPPVSAVPAPSRPDGAVVAGSTPANHP